MARAIWTGSINFGLVSIPVGLYSASEDHSVHFHQFQRGTADRIHYQRVNERTGKEVDYADIVKGRDIGGGEFVIVEPEELEAMAQANRAGIANFVMRGKEYLAAIRADDGVLALETLLFADEVRKPADALDALPQRASAQGKELEMATALIESMSEPWHPESYHDTYTERVEQLIDAKRLGHEIVTESESPRPTEMSDLLQVLQCSVDSARSGRRPRRRTDDEPDLSDASKADLAEMARDLDIAGRSTMNRDELEKAVASASRTTSA